jgi:hypothetical protein
MTYKAPKTFASATSRTYRFSAISRVTVAGRVGQHWFSYKDPTWLAERHVPAPPVAVLAAALAELVRFDARTPTPPSA